MNKKKQYLAPAVELHKMPAPLVMLGNSGTGLTISRSEENEDPDGPNPNARQFSGDLWEE